MLRTTLLAEGSSDRALIPILRWALAQNWTASFAEPDFAEHVPLARFPRDLVDRLRAAAMLYPCHLLFVHRDADRTGPEQRVREIERAVSTAFPSGQPTVCVVPVRSTEAWLLIDEDSIRQAAGRPFGKTPLELPRLERVESVAAPKRVLHQALRIASERTGRRLAGFRTERAVHRVANLIEDFAALRRLPAFCCFEESLRGQLAVLSAVIPTVR